MQTPEVIMIRSNQVWLGIWRAVPQGCAPCEFDLKFETGFIHFSSKSKPPSSLFVSYYHECPFPSWKHPLTRSTRWQWPYKHCRTFLSPLSAHSQGRRRTRLVGLLPIFLLRFLVEYSPRVCSFEFFLSSIELGCCVTLYLFVYRNHAIGEGMFEFLRSLVFGWRSTPRIAAWRRHGTIVYDSWTDFIRSFKCILRKCCRNYRRCCCVTARSERFSLSIHTQSEVMLFKMNWESFRHQ